MRDVVQPRVVGRGGLWGFVVSRWLTFFIATAGTSVVYLTVSEIFPGVDAEAGSLEHITAPLAQVADENADTADQSSPGTASR